MQAASRFEPAQPVRPAAPRFEPAQPVSRVAPRFEPAQPVRPAAPARPPAPPRAEAPVRREPPPLDPIDLDQALRDFRDAPEDVLRSDASWTEDAFELTRTQAAPHPEQPDAYQDPAFAGFEEGYYPEYETDGDAEAAYAADPYDQYDQYAEPNEKRPRRGTFFAVGILMGLVVLGGAAAYLYKQGVGSDSDGPLPIIRADNQPAKIAPDDPGGETIPNQDRLVYNRVSGETTEPEPTIVPREEEILVPPTGPAKEEGRFPADGAPAATAGEPAAINAERGSLAPLAAAPPPSGGIAPVPRRVKTVVVRPDGSIVTIEPQEVAPSPSAPQPATAAVPTPPSRPQTTPVRVASNGSNTSVTPVQPVRGAPLALNSQAAGQPIPQPAPQVVARATPQQPEPTAIGSDAEPAEYVVQLAARRNEQQARDAYDSLRSQYSSLLGRYQPLIQRTDLGQAGIYYRVRVGPMTNAADANQLCDQLKAAGLPDCLVRRR